MPELRFNQAQADARLQAIALQADALAKKASLSAADVSQIDELQAEADEIRSRDWPAEDPIDGGSSTGGNAQPLEDRSFGSVCRAVGAPVSMGEWRSTSEFLQAVANAHQQADPRLKRSGGQSSELGSLGGFAVPSEMARSIFDASLEGEIVRSRARLYPMRSSTLRVPAWESSDHSSGLYGGLSASWAGEGEELAIKKARVRSVELVANKLAFLGKLPSELMEDSELFAREFQSALSVASSFHMDHALLTGDGVGKPLGAINSANSALIVVDKENGQEAASITYRNAADMFGRLTPQSRGRAVWVASNSAVPQLLTMSVEIGTSGEFVPAVKERNGTMSLLGLPLVTTEKVPSVGNQGDFSLIDFGLYGVGLRAEMSLLFSQHAFLTTDEIAARLRVRVAGAPLLVDPITPIGGGPTMSPFITLEARTS